MAVTDEAILRIKEMIVTGELAPGAKLPPEKELSESLGLSRSSLREAVKALAVIRVLDVRRGDGTYVTSLAPDLLLEALSFVVELQRDDSILQVLAVRRMLEPQAAALAASRIDEETLDVLDRAIAEVDSEGGVEELVAHDIDFHHRINDAAGNTYLTSLLDSLSGQTVRARLWRGITQAGVVSRTLDEHGAILAALRRGDAELVRALMIAHVSGVEQWLEGVR
jgi:DNA-binding FadR family transcriptional regulator